MSLLYSVNTRRVSSGGDIELELVGKGGGMMKLAEDGLQLPSVGEDGRLMTSMSSLGSLGKLRYNTTSGGLELSNTSGTFEDVPKPPPTVTAIEPLSIPVLNASITVTGKNFGPRTPNVYFVGNDGTEFLATTVSSLVMNERLLVTVPDEVIAAKAKEPFKLKIYTKNKLEVITEAPLVIDINEVPIFVTDSDLGTFTSNSLITAIPVSKQIVATDPENNTPLVFSSSNIFSATNGSLSFSSGGFINGNLRNPGVDTTYSFNVRVTDTTGNFTDKTYGFDVSMPSPVITEVYPLSVPIIDASVTIVGNHFGRADILPSVYFVGSDNVKRQASSISFSSPYTSIHAVVPSSVTDNSSLEPFAVEVRRPDGQSAISSAPNVIDINAVPQFLNTTTLATLFNNSCQLPITVDISLVGTDPEENYPLVFSSSNIGTATNNELTLSEFGGITGTLTNPTQTTTYTFDSTLTDSIGNFTTKTFDIVFETPPLEVTGITPLSIPVLDASIVITGIALGSSPPTVEFVGQDNSVYRSQQVSVLSDNTIIKATVPTSVTDASDLEPFAVRITKSGFDPVTTNSPFVIDINGRPYITTDSVLPSLTSLTLYDSQNVDVTLVANDQENDTPFVFTSEDIATATNSELSLSEDGKITGTLSNPGTNTTFTFTVKVTDSVTNFTSKQFTLDFNVPDPVINSVSTTTVTGNVTTIDIVGRHYGSTKPTVIFIANDNTQYPVLVSSLSVVGDDEIMNVTIPDGMRSNAQKSPFLIKLTRADGVFVTGTGNEITVNQLPVFTSNEDLGEVRALDDVNPVNIDIQMNGTDPDNNLPLAFSSSNLGSASNNQLVISSAGNIEGTLTNPGASTTYNFNVRLVDAFNEGPLSSFFFNLSVPVPVALNITNASNLSYDVMYLDMNGSYNSAASGPYGLGGTTIYRLYTTNDTANGSNYIKNPDGTANISAVNAKNTSQSLVVQSDYVLIAGGGGGGGDRGGGGGAGGVIQGVTTLTSASITVGNGGSGSTGWPYPLPTNGNDTIAFGQTAVGGGFGGSELSGHFGRAGGSGGGASSWYQQYYGGAGVPGQGYNGGNAYQVGDINDAAAGGGGGAGGVGSNGDYRRAGNGGPGIDLKSFLGTSESRFFAAGGGGSGSGAIREVPNNIAGTGGSGIGGNGQYILNGIRQNATWPVPATGSGGGGRLTNWENSSSPGSGGVIFIKVPSYVYA